MNGAPLKARRIASFLQLAKEEGEAARKLAAPLPRQAMYFVQQAVEKLLRAVLEQEGIPAGASHNLRFLADLLPEGHVMKERFFSFDALSPASTRYRYPSASGRLAGPNSEEVETWIEKLDELENALKDQMFKNV